MRQLYAGCDLHGNNNLIGIVDGEGKRIFRRKLSNDLLLVRDTLKPFKEELVGIAVESTYNWYWMVDGLMETGYKIHLANPSAIQQYSGLKHSDDKHDAFWLARLSKKSPSRFLREMQKKMTSQNAPQSTISQLRGVMRPPKTTH